MLSLLSIFAEHDWVHHRYVMVAIWYIPITSVPYRYWYWYQCVDLYKDSVQERRQLQVPVPVEGWNQARCHMKSCTQRAAEKYRFWADWALWLLQNRYCCRYSIYRTVAQPLLLPVLYLSHSTGTSVKVTY